MPLCRILRRRAEQDAIRAAVRHAKANTRWMAEQARLGYPYVDETQPDGLAVEHPEISALRAMWHARDAQGVQ